MMLRLLTRRLCEVEASSTAAEEFDAWRVQKLVEGRNRVKSLGILRDDTVNYNLALEIQWLPALII